MDLIIVNGLPGTGKSTLAKKLADELSLPIIMKDGIKEFLFDALGTKDRAWSGELGKFSYKYLYELTDFMLENGHSVIIENAFERKYSKPAIQQIIEKNKPDNVYEIYCFTDATTRRNRYKERNESGNRHIGHVDHLNYLSDSDPEPTEKYAPLDVGALTKIDTTDFKNVKTMDILANIKS